MKTVRLGIIGSGPRAQTLIRETCRSLPGLQIAALAEPRRALLQQGAALIGNPSLKTYADHRQLLKEAPVEAVFIIVEPENCPSLVLESLHAGKHVLSEVPMAFSMEDCWRIVTTVERTGLIYQLSEQARYLPFVEAWTGMAARGELGRIVYAEGEYLHGMTEDRYYLDPVTGQRLTLAEARAHPNPARSRVWNMAHPILYLPHELSPLLRVLNDRVTNVVCLGTPQPGLVHDFFPHPDMETAVMQTAGGALLRLTCGFTTQTVNRQRATGHHWYRVIGSKGSVETHRSDADQMKWLKDLSSGTPEEVWWDWDRTALPPEALASGHDGADYHPIQRFLSAVRNQDQPEMDVYRAADSAAPAIAAAASAAAQGAPQTVPDFRPGPHRNQGQSSQ